MTSFSQYFHVPLSRCLHSLPRSESRSDPGRLPSPSIKGRFEEIDRLGATNKLTRIVLITSFTIVGTMETIFWAIVLRVKFEPEPKAPVEVEGV